MRWKRRSLYVDVAGMIVPRPVGMAHRPCSFRLPRTAPRGSRLRCIGVRPHVVPAEQLQILTRLMTCLCPVRRAS